MTKRGKSVRIEGLTKHYGSARVLDDLSIDIAPGEFCTLLGASGSGKTTLLKVMVGFEPFESGRVSIDGRDMRDVPVERRNIGMVFQNYALFPNMNVGANIGFGLEVRGMAKAAIARRVDDALAQVGLAGIADRPPAELSGGQQQRVALARALVIDPDILVMDEPLGALDKNLRQAIQLQLKQLHRALGLTIVYVTHDQDEALHLSDRIAIMDAGRIVQQGTPREVYFKPRTPFVATFLGECNVWNDAAGPLALRPEHVAVTKAEGAAGPGVAVVEAVIFLGGGQKIVARDGDRQVTAIVPYPVGAPELQIGERIRYSYDECSVHRFA